MRHPSLLAALVLGPLSLAAITAMVACGEDSRDLDVAAGGAAGSTSLPQGGSSNGGSGGQAPSSAICPGAAAAANADICPPTGPEPTCSQATSKPVQVCNVLARADSVDAARTDSTEEYFGSGPIDTSCFEKANWKTPGTPKMVTMKGFVRNFSNGCDAKGVKIEVFTVKRTGGADDGLPDQLIGSAVTTASDTCTGEPGCKLVEVEEKCPSKPRVWRAYEYPNVPTETELLVKTSAPEGSTDYTTLYDYNVYIENDDPGVAEGTYERPLRAVLITDFTLIPQAAYGGTITPGNGAVAGEIHDCGDVRVGGATFGVSRKGEETYFTDNEKVPIPTNNGTSTSIVGLYATFDLAPGPVRLVAAGKVGGAQTTLGYYDVRIFPDSVTSLTFRGFRPWQAAAAAK